MNTFGSSTHPACEHEDEPLDGVGFASLPSLELVFISALPISYST